MKEKAFYTGEDYGSIIPQISPEIIGSFPLNYGAFYKYITALGFQSMPPYMDHQLVIHNIYGYLVTLNMKISEVYVRYKQIKEAQGTAELQVYNLNKQSIIHLMKKIIDDLIILYCIKLDYDNTLSEKKIKVTSLGKLNGTSTLINSIKNELNYANFEELFTTINNLHNAFKHDIMINESSIFLGENNPTITAFYAPYGNLADLHFLNNSFTQVIMGFNDFIEDLLKVKAYSKNHIINEYDLAN